MKKTCILTAIIFYSLTLCSQTIDLNDAVKIANNKLISDGKTINFSINTSRLFYSGAGNPLFYQIELSPTGYISISANKSLSPIIAYSYTNNTDSEGKFVNFVKKDLEKRIQYIDKFTPEQINKISQQWDELNFIGHKTKKVFQQWPEAGTTTSGGWVEVNWTQTSPYNNFCPIDPVTDNRSIAGCPSVAMAMILDFHKTINQVNFNDADDYHHIYSGRNYWIDDDYIARDFPSWPMLNDFLDTLQQHYNNGISISNTDKAALVYACGVAAKQVYTSSGSGTFSVSQAFDAYLKFNFAQAQLLDTSDIADSSFYKIIIQNIKDTMPVHLAIVDSLWSSGHNIVADGFNTDGFFHFNFGWGGSANGWYLMLDNMPYSMNFIEGAVVDIKPGSSSNIKTEFNESLKAYPNPATNFVNIEIPDGNPVENYISVWNSIGQNTALLPLVSINNNKFIVNISSLDSGVYSGVIVLKDKFLTIRIIKL